MYSAAAEVGQGVVNVMAQVARTELDVENVVVAPHTTEGVASAGSSSASRQTWMTAGAVQLACREVRSELARRGGSLEPGDEISVERVYRHARTYPLDPETGQIVGGERAHVAFACSAMRVVAEVDVELGLTRVVWIGTAQDVGRAINPQAVYGQIEGGTAQGLGLALMEEIQTKDGLITNASFTDYLIPTALDMPPSSQSSSRIPSPTPRTASRAWGSRRRSSRPRRSSRRCGTPPGATSSACRCGRTRSSASEPIDTLPTHRRHHARAFRR